MGLYEAFEQDSAKKRQVLWGNSAGDRSVDYKEQKSLKFTCCKHFPQCPVLWVSINKAWLRCLDKVSYIGISELEMVLAACSSVSTVAGSGCPSLVYSWRGQAEHPSRVSWVHPKGCDRPHLVFANTSAHSWSCSGQLSLMGPLSSLGTQRKLETRTRNWAQKPFLVGKESSNF